MIATFNSHVRDHCSSRHSLVYVAIVDHRVGQGILKKIAGFVGAAEAAGWQVRTSVDSRRGVKAHLAAVKAVACAKEAVILIRGTAHFLPALSVAALIARLRGRTVVLDVPTPHAVAVQEVRNSLLSLPRRFWMILLLTLS
ncbi:MAG: hypothetical protein RLZZ169_1647, partial [Pseudomonadota bacterium]